MRQLGTDGLKTSYFGVLSLIEFEGVVLVPYRDSAGVLTIGVGHTAAAGAPDPAKVESITIDGAFSMLRRDLKKYEAEVSKAVTVPLKQHEFDALVSFHFNTGAIARANLTKWLNAGDRARAANGFLAWKRAGGNPTALLSRRNAERTMFMTGDYGEPFMARIYKTWPSKGTIWNLRGLIPQS